MPTTAVSAVAPKMHDVSRTPPNPPWGLCNSTGMFVTCKYSVLRTCILVSSLQLQAADSIVS